MALEHLHSKIPSFPGKLPVGQVEFVALQVLQLLKASDRVRNSLLHDSNAEEVPIASCWVGFFSTRLCDSPEFCDRSANNEIIQISYLSCKNPKKSITWKTSIHADGFPPSTWSPCQDSAGYTVFHAVVPRSSDKTKRRGDDVDHGTIWLSAELV